MNPEYVREEAYSAMRDLDGAWLRNRKGERNPDVEKFIDSAMQTLNRLVEQTYNVHKMSPEDNVS